MTVQPIPRIQRRILVGRAPKEATVARTAKTAPVAAPSTSKSDRVRALLAEGQTIVQIVKTSTAEGWHVGYPFAYGIAKQAGMAQTAAARRSTGAPRFVLVLGAAIYGPFKTEEAARAANGKGRVVTLSSRILVPAGRPARKPAG